MAKMASGDCYLSAHFQLGFWLFYWMIRTRSPLHFIPLLFRFADLFRGNYAGPCSSYFGHSLSLFGVFYEWRPFRLALRKRHDNDIITTNSPCLGVQSFNIANMGSFYNNSTTFVVSFQSNARHKWKMKLLVYVEVFTVHILYHGVHPISIRWGQQSLSSTFTLGARYPRWWHRRILMAFYSFLWIASLTYFG